MAEGRDKKLKELEESLAKELDQEVNLTEPSDARLKKDVALNPNIKSDKGEAEKKPQIDRDESSRKKDPTPDSEVSLDNLDETLDSEDGIKADKTSEDEGGESEEKEIPVDPSSLDQEIFEELGTETRLEAIWGKIKEPLEHMIYPLIEFAEKLLARAIEVKEGFQNFRSWGVPQFHSMLSWFRKTLPEWLKSQKHKLSQYIKNKKVWFANLDLTQRFSLFGIILIFFVLVAGYLLKDHLEIVPPELGKIRTFADIKGIRIVKKTKPLINIEIADDELDNVVELPRVTANLPTSRGSSRNPMARLQMFIVVTTKEGAVEIKYREGEIRDYATRVLESMTYEELESPAGLELYKDRIRRSLNRTINDGYVKKIYFKNVTVKR